MKIDDLLSQAGSKPLKEFGWAGGVVDLINSELTVDRKITGDITGGEAYAIIRTLSAAALVRLLTARIQPDGRLIEEEPPYCTPVVMPAPAPIKPRMSWLVKIGLLRAAFPLFVGGTITLMGMLLAATVAFTSVKTKKVPNQSTLQGIGQIMVEMVKVYRDANAAVPAPQPEPKQPVQQPVIIPPSYPTDEQPEPLLPE